MNKNKFKEAGWKREEGERQLTEEKSERIGVLSERYLELSDATTKRRKK